MVQPMRHALNSAQKRMMFLHRLTDGGVPYIVGLAYRISGRLNESFLRSALLAVMQRHQMLRSTFSEELNVPIRLVQDSVSVPITSFTLDVPPEGWDATVRDRAEELKRKPFELSNCPLFRCEVLRLAPQEFGLLFAFHHIVIDGWSLGVFQRDLSRAYASVSAGAESPLGVQSNAIEQAVNAEREFLVSKAGEIALGRRVDALRGIQAVELPFSRYRSPVSRFKGRKIETSLSEGTVQSLEMLGRSHKASLFTVLVATVVSLLHRYSGQEDIVVGAPMANRVADTLKDEIGLFMNSVPIRLSFDPGRPLSQLLDDTRVAVLDALEDQDVPFERIVERIAPDRSLSHNPIFQVMVTLQNASESDLNLPGIDVVPIDMHEAAALLDLEVTFWRRKTDLRMRVTYNSDAFSPDVVARLSGHLQAVLRAFATSPGCRVSEVNLLSESELHDLRIRETGATPVESDCLHHVFEANVASRPQSTAVADANTSLTYAQLDAQANAVAHALAVRGVGKGSIVCISMDRCVDLVAAILGVLKAGAAFLPLNPDDPPDRHAFMLDDAEVQVVVTSSLSLSKIVASSTRQVILTDSLPRQDAFESAVAIQPSDLAYVMYTSGTTGRPKGVLVEHKSICNTVLGCSALLRFRPDYIGLVLAPFTFDVFYFELFGPILNGGTSRLVSRAELFDTSRLCALLKGAIFFQAVPGMMEHLLDAMRSEKVTSIESVRCVMTGGDLVPNPLYGRIKKAFPNARTVVTYGPTESAVFATLYEAIPGQEHDGYPIGFPLPGVTVRVCDASGRVLPVGVKGELWIGGRGVARGYLGVSNETAERFVETDAGVFYRSGDLGRRLEDGCLEFSGRADTQVKIRGFRIELAEVEAALCRSPEISEAIVVVRGDDHSSRRLGALVVPTEAAISRAMVEAEAAQLESWEALFDATYGRRTRHVADGEDFTGWQSAITGEAIPLDQMTEWLDGVVAQILGSAPRENVEHRNLRLLEIGCGTGLVLRRLAPYCASVLGTDFSQRVLADLKQAVGNEAWSPKVELVQCAAHQLDALNGRLFDLVVLNSVVQYFPSEQYLLRVIRSLATHVREGGVIFVGDVRSLPLLPLFHATTSAHVTPPTADQSRVARDVRRRVDSEQELLIDPAIAEKLETTIQEIDFAECLIHRGSKSAELAGFRYDIVLHIGRCAVGRSIEWRSWSGESWSVERLDEWLGADHRTDFLGLTGIPNGLLPLSKIDVAQTESICGFEMLRVPGGEAVFPDTLQELAVRHGWQVRLSAIGGSFAAEFDVLFSRDGLARPERRPAVARLANTPLRSLGMRRISSSAQRQVSSHLPAYMMPATIDAVDRFVRTTNGKVDREAVNFLYRDEFEFTDRLDWRPLSPAETIVATAWSEVLGPQNRAPKDDFFEAGGTSLLAVQLSSALRTRGVDVSPQAVFELRTIERMALNSQPKGEELHARRTGRGVQTAQSHVANRELSYRGLERAVGSWETPQRILLTGATGILGVHVLRELLLSTPVEVICLLRGGDDRTVFARLREQYAWYFGSNALGEFSSRVTAIRGDLSVVGLGLSDLARMDLAASCRAIINVAADVRHLGDPGPLFATNRDGVAELVRLARSSTSIEFHQVSTVGVKGAAFDDEETEHVITEQDRGLPRSVRDHYSESKAQGEAHVLGFLEAGGRGSIVRVGTVAPHSQTGKFQRNIDDHFFSRFVRGTLELGFALDDQERVFRLAPVDLLARALIRLTGHADEIGPVFHVQGAALPFRTFVDMLRSAGYGVSLLPALDFSSAVREAGRESSGISSIARMLPLLEPSRSASRRLESNVTERWLKQLGIEIPPPSQEWIGRFLRFGEEKGYFPSSAHSVTFGVRHTPSESISSPEP